MSDTGKPSSIEPGQDRQPLVVGLTGGIGSGKSTVARIFSSLGVPVIDADILARQLVEPGQPALAEIRKTFGTRAITADGHLDRTFLRQRIFSNQDEKQKLEAILHSRIRHLIRHWVSTVKAPYCIAVIPLLLETGQTDLVDRVLVVDTTENEQLKRVAARDGLTHNVIMSIMGTQADRETRRAAAHDIIDNNRDISQLESRIRALHEHYLEISHDD